MNPVLGQTSRRCDLAWVAFDPVNLVFTVLAADWSGTYKAEVRDGPHRHANLLDELTVTAVYVAPDTNFTLTLADSSKIPSGGWWDMQQDNGLTRLSGRVIVTADVSS